jgi:hypothetical protein
MVIVRGDNQVLEPASMAASAERAKPQNGPASATWLRPGDRTG